MPSSTGADEKASSKPPRRAKRNSPTFRNIALLTALALAAFVALKPDLIYAPTPRVVLYLLVALIPAILFATELSARFELRLGWFVASAGGAAALVLITLVILTKLTKPEQQIAVFEILDEREQPVIGLDRNGVVEIPRLANGLTIKPLIDGNQIVLIFPEQAPNVELRLRPILSGPVYRGRISYAGSRISTLTLGRDLIANGR